MRENGFVSDDGTDTVTVKLFARRENNTIKCQDKDNYIRFLKSKISKLNWVNGPETNVDRELVSKPVRRRCQLPNWFL